MSKLGLNGIEEKLDALAKVNLPADRHLREYVKIVFLSCMGEVARLIRIIQDDMPDDVSSSDSMKWLAGYLERKNDELLLTELPEAEDE